MGRSLFQQLSLLTWFCGLVFVNATALAGETVSGEAITGVGAHFSWAVFNELESSLEHRFGRPLKLYGKESMMGAGCSAGIKMAQANRPGKESFGFICCPLNKSEIAKEGITLHTIAREPILILVNKSNPINDIPLKKLRAIFRGEITNWKQVGGADKPIVVVTRLHCNQHPGHWKTILPSKDQFRKERLNVKSAADMVRRVSDFPAAIGHTGATWEFDLGDEVKAIKVGGVAPTADNLRRGKYPFHRLLSAVTNDKASKDVLDIIREVQTGPEFRKVAKKYELVPVQPKRQ